jgi:hypothetical protein
MSLNSKLRAPLAWLGAVLLILDSAYSVLEWHGKIHSALMIISLLLAALLLGVPTTGRWIPFDAYGGLFTAVLKYVGRLMICLFVTVLIVVFVIGITAQ